jgi:hypothetical protein
MHNRHVKNDKQPSKERTEGCFYLDRPYCLLFPNHFRTAFWASKINAAFPDLMRLCMAALRANTLASWTGAWLIAPTTPAPSGALTTTSPSLAAPSSIILKIFSHLSQILSCWD